MIFPIETGDWTLDTAQITIWIQLYPDLDVHAELNKAWAWLDSNPMRRKTARGMPRFLVAWLNRAEPHPWKDRPPMRQAYDQWKHSGGCQHDPICPHFTACYLVSQRTLVLK